MMVAASVVVFANIVVVADIVIVIYSSSFDLGYRRGCCYCFGCYCWDLL